MKKRILSTVFMVFLTIFAIGAINVSAETEGIYTYSVSDGKATITKCASSASGAIEIPSTLGGCPVTSIGSSAFKNCSSLTSVTIPNSVTSIRDSAFSSCSSLTSVTIGNSVTSIGDSAFLKCSSLTSVTIPDSVRNIGDGAFYGCSGLTSITIPDGMKLIGDYAFYGCTGLTSITIPDSVTTIYWYTFCNCTSLTSIEVDSGNKQYSSLDGNLFNKNQTRIMQYAIGKYDSHYTIPDSVTSIGDGAFSECTNLTSVTIPDSVTRIAYGAFNECTSLKDVYYSGTEDEWNDINIGSENSYLENATIHYNYASDTIVYNAENKTIELKSYYAISGKVVVTTYNGNKLVNTTLYDASQTINNVEIDPNSATTAKIFWWDSFKSLVPKCDALEITL